jgi:hypothetical protein
LFLMQEKITVNIRLVPEKNLGYSPNTKVTRIRTSPRHGRAGRFFRNFQSLICRGGTPFGAAAFIVHGIERNSSSSCDFL